MKLTCTQRDLLNGYIELLRAEATVKRQQGLDEEREARKVGPSMPLMASPGSALCLEAASLYEVADLIETLVREAES